MLDLTKIPAVLRSLPWEEGVPHSMEDDKSYLAAVRFDVEGMNDQVGFLSRDAILGWQLATINDGLEVIAWPTLKNRDCTPTRPHVLAFVRLDPPSAAIQDNNQQGE